MLIPLLCAAGVQVRALVRDEAKAQPLRDQGVEVVFSDLDRPETLDAAVDGADKVYLITWNGPPGVTHGHNLMAAVQRGGRPRIVKQGGYGSPRSRIIQHHWQNEFELRTSGLPYTLLRPTLFMQNAMMGAQTVASDGVKPHITDVEHVSRPAPARRDPADCSLRHRPAARPRRPQARRR